MDELAGHELADARLLWDYGRLDHPIRTAEAGIGLGSHDLGVATRTAELWHRGAYPLIVFTGANAPTTVAAFPRGEAVHYREHALSLGVPAAAIVLEPRARNTGENIAYARDLLPGVRTVTLVSKPYQQRRAYATCRMQWPEADVRCTAEDVRLEEYAARIGVRRLLSMLVGDTVRITTHARSGYAIPQEVPPEVDAACARLIRAGYIDRI